jgi:hypothetical protein
MKRATSNTIIRDYFIRLAMARQAASFEGDGISEQLFELLWSKDALNFSPQVSVPDTVIFRFGQPVFWYFTATNGRIKRKNRQNLMNSKIEDAFNKHVLGYDVIATFVSMPVENKKGEEEPIDKVPRIEYLDKDGLSNLLYRRQKENHGVLQRFIEPKSTHNELIRAIWSPKICLIERTRNINQLQDTRFGIYERCVTQEGPDYFVETAPLRGPVLAGQIQTLCEDIVSHVSEVTYSQKSISRMVLTLKLDARDKMWLVYSTSIRLYDNVSASTDTKNLLNIDSVVALPQSIHLNPHRSFIKTVARASVNCISCGKETLEDQRQAVQYKYVVKHYEYFTQMIAEDAVGDPILMWPPEKAARRLIEACGGVGFGCLDLVSSDDTLLRSSKLNLRTFHGNENLRIPLLLRYLHPRLSASSYLGCKNDPLFLYKSTDLCENCYLAYAQFATLVLRNGSDVPKLSRPDPADSTSRPVPGRPTSADWKAMSEAAHRSRVGATDDNRNSSMFKTGMSSDAMVPQPMIPPPILAPIGTKGVITNVFSQQSNSNESPTKSFKYSQKEVNTSIAERERVFFNEVSKNPQLRDHHPLMHLIASQRKLEDANMSIATSDSSSRAQGLFGTAYGQQLGDKYDKYSSYKTEIPYTMNGVTIKPSRLKVMRQHEAQKRRAMTLASMQSHKSPLLAGASQVSQSSTAGVHSEFLEATLAKIDKVFETSNL